jgi:hypothetical protein
MISRAVACAACLRAHHSVMFLSRAPSTAKPVAITNMANIVFRKPGRRSTSVEHLVASSTLLGVMGPADTSRKVVKCSGGKKLSTPVARVGRLGSSLPSGRLMTISR